MIKKLDWNESWKQAMLDSSWNNSERDLVEFWNNKASDFNENMENHTKRAQKVLKRMNLKCDQTILDVGAGTGAISIPIAKVTKQVTAVEPSRGMLDYLKANAKKENVENITCINKKWEDVELENDIEKYDIVFASYSISMLDIKETLYKMNQATKKTAYLFTSAAREEDKLWKKIHKEDYSSGPDYIYIVNVLYQMGIYANVEISEDDFIQEYKNIDDAVSRMQKQYENYTAETEKIIREYFEENLVEDNGKLCLKSKRGSAVIWWNKK